ncbi:MAG: hypothetical protein HY719_04795 [Planctomycetes bacterium]|nr:hypothetical protein [Planctomycetota bacterium]
MGLRINSNGAALSALRQLAKADNLQSKNLERLSTGLRINRAADDPSGLVLSEQLRAQTASLRAAVRNSEFASNLVGTAEAALNEVSALLIGVRESVVFALNSGSLTTEQITAEQASVDQSLNAIDRIAAATRFGSRSLLDGSSAFQLTTKSSAMDSVSVRNVQFSNASSTTFRFAVTQVASRAMIRLVQGGGSVGSGQQFVTGNGTGGSIKFRVTGSLGTAEITLGSGATLRDFMNQVNANTQSTGVFASATRSGLSSVTTGAAFALFSSKFGSSESISLTRADSSGAAYMVAGKFAIDPATDGTFSTTTSVLTAGSVVTDKGRDIQVRIGSTPIQGKGNEVTVNTTAISGDFVFSQRYQIKGLDDKTNNNANFALSGVAFTVLNNSRSGLNFQLGESADPRDRISVGLGSNRTSDLGVTTSTENTTGSAASNTGALAGGAISSLRTGGGSDLFVNARNALSIVDTAISQVSTTRANLGSLQANTIDPNVESLNVAIENLSATESSIRDLDFAAETSNFVKNQILFQAATSVLSSANLTPQAVLSLLQ